MDELFFSTSNKNEVVSITRAVEKLVKGVKQGVCVVYVPHATAALTINESADPAVKEDFLKALDRAVPSKPGLWKHDRVDNNAAAHIKSAMVGCSLTIPIKNSRLQLGRWQELWLCEFDGPRERKVLVKVLEG